MKKSKFVYIVLALFLGGFGIHKLYEGKPFKFLLYICFAWSFIPCVIAFFEAIHALFMDDLSFDEMCK